MENKDGGPAFPSDKPWAGLSLRDYFAAAALNALIIRSANDGTAAIPYCSNGDLINRDGYAQTALQYADAVLAARGNHG